jgi:hypothetical protein
MAIVVLKQQLANASPEMPSLKTVVVGEGGIFY